MTNLAAAAPTVGRLTRQSSTPYADALAHYASGDTLRLNVPGHAADARTALRLAGYFGEDILRMDVPPLLPGLDKGHDNPLARARGLAAEAWGAHRTWFLTNGASQANRIVCLAVAAYRSTSDSVLVQRSVHSSVVDGIVLGGLNPRFLQPTIDQQFGIAHGVSPSAVAAALEATPGAKAVYITSPSYFGSVADIAEIARVSHDAGAGLIVDGAWASHFGFHPALPAHPLELGADVLISSVHKLGGSLTQSAMLHIAGTPFARELEPLLDRAFGLAQSTSENSLLLASLDIARATLVDGESAIEQALISADAIREGIRAQGRFGIASDSFHQFDDVVGVDPLHVSIDVGQGGVRGHAARDELMAQGIFLEIATETCVVAIVGPGHSVDSERFLHALHALPAGSAAANTPIGRLPEPGALALAPRNAFLAPTVAVDAEGAVGRISAETLAAYPPGIPNVMAGEIITAEVVQFLAHIASSPGGHVRGASDPSLRTFRIVV